MTTSIAKETKKIIDKRIQVLRLKSIKFFQKRISTLSNATLRLSNKRTLIKMSNNAGGSNHAVPYPNTFPNPAGNSALGSYIAGPYHNHFY